MNHFHALTIKELHREPAQTTVLTFDIPASLTDTFRYEAGQYLTLKVTLGGVEERRSYSLCSNPFASGPHSVAVKVVEGGKVSTYLHEQVKVGDSLEVMPPEGRFVPQIHANNAKTYGLWAGGSGITPTISILEAVLSQEVQSRVVLIYANSKPGEVIFQQRLENLQTQFGDRLKIVEVFSQSGGVDALHSGRIDENKAKQLLETYLGKGADREHYVCGPEGLMKAVVAALETSGVLAQQVHTEYFVAPEANSESAPAEAIASLAEGEKSEVTLILDGDTEVVSVGRGDKILDVALDSGIDAPYSCRGGVCASCMARLVEGEVEMALNFVLTDAEVDEGMIVTCQSHPKTAKITVSYDDI